MPLPILEASLRAGEDSVPDERYYRAVKSGLAERVFVAARLRIYRDFMTLTQPAPSDRILDVGVSDVVSEGSNILAQSYPFQDKITGCGIGTGEGFTKAFPRARYLRIEPNTRLPFEDASFEVATSNAVLEHVGNLENQLLFVRELSRVARRVFISVPNRLFPVEHHTAIPLAHYYDTTFKVACRLTGNTEWTQEANLILMTRKRLQQLAAPTGRRATFGYTGLLLGPFSSNLYLTLQ